MYPVSQVYQTAIKSTNRTWRIKMHIDTAFDSIDLTESDIVLDSLKVEADALGGSTFAPGGAVITALDVTVLNYNGRFNDVQFNGGLITASVGLQLPDNSFEWVPLGVFNIDDVSRPTAEISLGARDNMLLFDQLFSNVPITFPATNLQILSAICSYCGVALNTTSFINSSYVVQSAPDGGVSCRDVLSDIAELAAGFARCDRVTGALQIIQFKNPGCVLEASIDGNTDTADGGDFTHWDNKSYNGGVFAAPVPVAQLNKTNWFTFQIDDDPVTVTGIELDAQDKTYLIGSEYYCIHISDNKLIQGDPTAPLNNVFDVLHNFTFLPYTSTWQGNPALDPGDIIQIADRNGVVYQTLITGSNYAYGGDCELVAKGSSKLSNNYQAQATKKMSQLLRQIHQKQVQLDSLQQAILNATNLIAGALGGYAIQGTGQYEGNFFIADNQDITKATKVWRWNLGGFGYSKNGLAGPFTTAVTADGSIVASLITAGIVTADMIKAGILQSKDGSTSINLNDGSFSFGDGALTYNLWDGFNCIASKKLMTHPTDTTYGEIGTVTGGFGGLDLYAVGQLFCRMLWTASDGKTPTGFSIDLNAGPTAKGGHQCFGATEGDLSGSNLTYMQFGGGNGDQPKTEVYCDANKAVINKYNSDGSIKSQIWVDDNGPHAYPEFNGTIHIPSGDGYASCTLTVQDGFIKSAG